MKKKSLILNKIWVLITICMCVFANVYSQKITFDTLKSAKEYTKYVTLSKKILDSFRQNPNRLLNAYIKSHGPNNRTYLTSNFSEVHEFLLHEKLPLLKSLVLAKGTLLYPGYPFKETSLLVTYSLGRTNCTEPIFENTLTINFYDISKGEENFDLRFNTCLQREKLKKAILNIPVPKNN